MNIYKFEIYFAVSCEVETSILLSSAAAETLETSKIYCIVDAETEATTLRIFEAENEDTAYMFAFQWGENEAQESPELTFLTAVLVK